MRGRLKVGCAVRVPLGHRKVRGVVTALASRSDERELQEIDGLLWDLPIAPAPVREVMERLADRYVAPRGAVYARLLPRRVRVSVDEVDTSRAALEPSNLQRYEGGSALAEAIGRGQEGVWCITRAPRADAAALVAELLGIETRSEGSALVTVPEVRYGSLTLDRVASTFPDLARVDSSLSEGDRARSWLRLAAGHGLGGGGRSALFAPCPKLRLLVIDEEHHPTYKEDRSPRYDARWVALERARAEHALCVFLTKTPSLELGWKVKQGLCRVVQPPRAMRRETRPLVEVAAPRPDGLVGRELHERLRDALRAGQRAALLVPARGYARHVWCMHCRRSLRCPVCETGMALYRRRGLDRDEVRCPRCGHTEPAPQTCPRCGRSEWRLIGAGSERAAEQIARSFPRARVRRADPETLADVESEDAEAADIYVTTWIGTKASLRPEVALVGVVNADALIRRPSFRASERAYQALAEMAEWAGPADLGGRLVIQTEDPSHHAIQAVVRNDYTYFLERELPFRAELSYPPFTELIAIGATGSQQRGAIERAAVALRAAGAAVLGPVSAPPSAGGPGGLELLAKCQSVDAAVGELRAVAAEIPSGTSLRIDVDPR